MRRILSLTPVAVVALVVASCGPSGNTQQQLSAPPGSSREASEGSRRPPPPPNNAAADATPGQKVFAAQNCGKCHALNGAGKGLDLSKVGTKHDKAWIADHIRDAKKHNPMSKMEPFPEDRLNAKDLDTLAEYLAGLK